jgi:FAD:protein FMN transferase
MRILLVLLLLACTSCSREPLYQSQSYVFGTLVDISIYGESDDKARGVSAHVLADFQALHNQLHAWNGTSELSKLNTAIAQGRTPTEISPQLSAILKSAKLFSMQSQGLFDPSIGHLIGLWGFQSDTFNAIQIPQTEIQAWLAQRPSMQDLNISSTQLVSINKGVKLDLGGFAKGYALDQARDYLRAQGVNHALINIGGNIIALGKHGQQAWRVGIQHPRKPNPMATLDLPDGWAIGTSGDYQRFFELNGQRYCHILDPNTGYPARHYQAVTVLIPPSNHAGTLSDVASKPLFIASPSEQASYAKRMGISHYLVINAQGQAYASPEMAKRINWLKQD